MRGSIAAALVMGVVLVGVLVWPTARVSAAQALQEVAAQDASAGWVAVEWSVYETGSEDDEALAGGGDVLPTARGVKYTNAGTGQNASVLLVPEDKHGVSFIDPVAETWSWYDPATGTVTTSALDADKARAMREEPGVEPTTVAELLGALESKWGLDELSVEATALDGQTRYDVLLSDAQRAEIPSGKGAYLPWSVSVWADDATGRALRSEARYDGGKVMVMAYRVLEEGIESIYDLGVPADAVVVEAGPKDVWEKD